MMGRRVKNIHRHTWGRGAQGQPTFPLTAQPVFDFKELPSASSRLFLPPSYLLLLLHFLHYLPASYSQSSVRHQFSFSHHARAQTPVRQRQVCEWCWQKEINEEDSSLFFFSKSGGGKKKESDYSNQTQLCSGEMSLAVIPEDEAAQTDIDVKRLTHFFLTRIFDKDFTEPSSRVR